MQYYFRALDNFLDFEGRSTRQEFWGAFFGHFVVYVTFSVVFGILGYLTGSFTLLTIPGLYSTVILVPAAAIGIRRLHDTNRSGWWALFPLYNLFLFCLPGDTEANRFGQPPVLTTMQPGPMEAEYQNLLAKRKSSAV